uniref:BPTI/Kunitz inhibitor domain-containing protein n=1 Tax=Parascaris univalens TaxID=6257 RepID=A0A915BT75_PARUN
ISAVLSRVMLLHVLIVTLLICIFESAHLPGPPVFTAVQHYPSICYLPPESGLCSLADSQRDNSDDEKSDAKNKLLIRYYFDTTTQQCYQFGVDNCGGNENRFETLAACQAFCELNKT